MVDEFSSLICSQSANVLWLDACSCQESTICVDEVIFLRARNSQCLAPDHAHTKTAKYRYPLMVGMRILPERSEQISCQGHDGDLVSDVDAKGLSILGRLGGSCCILGSVVEQSNMGAYFVSQCFVVICVGLLLVITLRILVVVFLSSCSERSGCVHVSCPHWIDYATEFG